MIAPKRRESEFPPTEDRELEFPPTEDRESEFPSTEDRESGVPSYRRYKMSRSGDRSYRTPNYFWINIFPVAVNSPAVKVVEIETGGDFFADLVSAVPVCCASPTSIESGGSMS